ncbi:MAG: helix-turn-helix transcriptional regulator [Dehalococcoidia bacterium]|jgi:transcriptional regulator with XRE-family HTH domain
MSDIDQQIVKIKARLTLARKQAGLSQSQAAQLLSLKGASSFTDYESGTFAPALDKFLRLCEIYGVSPVWALTGVNPDFDATEILQVANGANQDILKIVDLLSSLNGGGA